MIKKLKRFNTTGEVISTINQIVEVVNDKEFNREKKPMIPFVQAVTPIGSKNLEGITCPLCDHFCKHKEIPKGKDEATHYWSCPNCSFVGLEYIDPRDIINLGIVVN